MTQVHIVHMNTAQGLATLIQALLKICQGLRLYRGWQAVSAALPHLQQLSSSAT
jgi:hypothetical protein